LPAAALSPAELQARRARVAAQLQADPGLSFGAAGAHAALEMLRSARGATEEQRAIALTAVGGGRLADGRDLLEAEARYGPGLERLAAILALGEMGEPNLALYTELVRDPDENVRGAACLALIRGGAGLRVGELAAHGTPEVAAAALAAIEYQRQPLQHLEFKPGLLRLSLRERAAAMFGGGHSALPTGPASESAPAPTAPAALPVLESGEQPPPEAVAVPAAEAAAVPADGPASAPVEVVPTPAVPTPALPTPAVPTPEVPAPALPTPAVPTPALPVATATPVAGARERAPRPAVVELGALMELAVELDRPALRDHVLELLLDESDPSVAAAAVRVMPEQVAQLMLAGLWRPRDAAQWAALVDAIDRGRLERRALDVLRAALSQPDVRAQAASLLLAAGVREARDVLSGASEAQRADQRLWLALGMARSGDVSWIGELSGLALDADPLVRAAAVLAQARLGHGPANERLRERARPATTGAAVAGTALEASAVTEVLWRVGPDPAWLTWIQAYHAISSGEERLRLSVRLVQHGRLSLREPLRAALAQRAETPLPSDLLLELVRALAEAPDARDLAALESLATARSAAAPGSPGAVEPSGLQVEARSADGRALGDVAFDTAHDEQRIDALLLLTLVHAKHPRGLALLRKTLWRAPRPLACIAAQQWIHGGGLSSLEAVLDSPPARSSEQDLRRAGFAYGRSCGWPALDRLAQRKRPDDPLLQGAWLGALSARTL
jgi:hypothetical protein